MANDAADVIEAGIREIRIFVAGEHRLAVFPQRLMHMHARAIVAIDGLRHEGRRLAIALRHLMDAVFVDLHLIGHLGQRRELETKFMLGGGHFVVMLFDLGAHRRHGGEHFAAHVLR